MSAIDAALADELLSHALDILRVDAATRQRVLDILNRMQRELVAKLATEGDITDFAKARLEALLRDTTAVIDSYYAKAQGESTVAMTEVARAVANATAGSADGILTIKGGVTLPTPTYLERLTSNVLITGSPAAEWWSKLSVDTAFKFATAVRQGAAAGETNEQIARRVSGGKGTPGVMDISRENARKLVHTSLQTVANAARLETFKRNGAVIESLVWMATLDSHTCLVCAVRDGQEYTNGDTPPKPIGHDNPWDGGPGAIHFSCRCVVTVKTKPIPGLNLPPGARASQDGPVSSKVSFEDFLNRKGEAFANDVLGKGRAALWREKKLTLDQLLSGGQPMTLTELRAKYG